MLTLKPQRNPYVIGRPISEEKLFYGRENELLFVLKAIQQNQKLVFLHGERRIGKSSIIQNIPEFLNQKGGQFSCVNFDLSRCNQYSLDTLLEGLVETIVEQLEIEIKIPSTEQIKAQGDIFSSKFFQQIDQKLVLLLDEVDTCSPETLEPLLKQLQKAVQNNTQLFIVISAGSKLTYYLFQIFDKVLITEIGLLDKKSATKLITEPAAGLLQYTPKAIQSIIDLSAGHPYFIQILCFALFSRARELEKWDVSEEDVELIIERAVELAEAGLAWYWDGLSIPEKLVFSAVAENSLTQLISHNLLPREELRLVTAKLVDRHFMQGDKVKIELVRRWLVQRHPLWQEIREFETANNL